MPDGLTIAVAALSILVLNLPFGRWRARSRKLSPQWFAAIHIPVPLAVGLRWLIGLRFDWRTLPIFVLAFFGGQALGGRWRGGRTQPPP